MKLDEEGEMLADRIRLNKSDGSAKLARVAVESMSEFLATVKSYAKNSFL